DVEAVPGVPERAVLAAVEDVQLVAREANANCVGFRRQFGPVLAAEPDVAWADLERYAAELAPLLRQRREGVLVVAGHVGELLVGDRLQVEVEGVAGDRLGLLRRRGRRRLLNRGGALLAHVREERDALNR